MFMQINLLGIPGTGTAYLARRLSETTGLPLLSTARTADAGDHRVQPDNQILSAILDQLQRSGIRNGFILSGFPSTLPQARSLDQMLAWQGLPITLAVLLRLPKDTLLQRIQGRRRCIECGEGINLALPDMANTTQCPFCGAALEIPRPANDISDEQILAAAERRYIRLGRYYRTQNKLLSVDITGEADTDLAKLQEALKRRNRL